MIAAFGEFLMGGETVIGLTIFAILIVINFVVITKGAGRIAEVAARFSLDAMPGKQMAIDADLSAGMITEQEARERAEAANSGKDALLATLSHDMRIPLDSILAWCAALQRQGAPLVDEGLQAIERDARAQLAIMEHLLDGADDLAVLLEAAPDLAILATSRAPLRLYGEHLYAVAPLPAAAPACDARVANAATVAVA